MLDFAERIGDWLILFVTIPIIATLLAFNARRLLFSLAILLPSRPKIGRQRISSNVVYFPEVLILAPCQDEEKMITGLCHSIRQLEYPVGRYKVCLIDDGSTDQTRILMEQFVQAAPDWQVLSLPRNMGKAGALNTALKYCSFGEIVYIFDADHRPKSDALKRAVLYFEDPLVAGVSGMTIPSNPLASPSAYYSTIENHVHRLITMRAKDRLDLAPALLGSNCAYRRTALLECGGFKEGSLLEDSDITLAFYRAGYRIRFAQDVEALHQVPETIRGYINQHSRWARGFMNVANQQGIGSLRDRELSLPLRVELFLFSAGYLDRIALIGAIAIGLLSLLMGKNFQLLWVVIALALLTPWIQVILLFAEQRMPLPMWLRLPFIPFFYVFDLVSAGLGVVDSLTRKVGTWKKTERSLQEDYGS